MKLLLAVLGLTAAMAFGQSAIAPPQLGWVRDANQGLRPVLGIAANFVLGDALSDGVVSCAFSGSFGMVKTDTAVTVLDRDGQVLFQADAEAGPALFAFSDDGRPAWVYLAQSQAFLSWKTDHLEPAPFDAGLAGGAVQAIAAPAADRATVMVKRDDGLWLVDLMEGAQTFVPGVDGPVLLRNDGALLYGDPQGVILRRADGSGQLLGGPVAIASFESMGKDWVHVTEQDSARHFAVRLTPGREQVYQLPEAQP